jgi:3-oxoacyl-[acyl-carrier-protein] synthase-3
MSVSILKAAVWMPDGFEDAAYIANAADLPFDVVKNKMGIIRKCRAPRDLHPAQMAINAGKEVLEGIDLDSIDVLIWTGSEYKDHIVWSAGIHVQEALNLKKAWAFDIGARCSNKVVGIKIATALINSDKKINRVLLIGGHKTGDLVNYKDPNTRFLFNLSDGASAMIIERGDTNPIGDTEIITNGSFSMDVILPAGGTKIRSRDEIKFQDTFLQVQDIAGMRDRLEKYSINNFKKVITDSTKSFAGKIDYLALLHMKRSAHDEIVKISGISPEQSIYLDHFGHFGAPDQPLSIALAEREEKLKAGSVVCLASAGIGYTWSAVCFRWNKNIFSTNNIKHIETIGGLK